ncbi:MAG: chorismate synthase [Clostridiales bacterium]|nr:chorismate synthase [Clostridiales bacterium]
MSVFKGEKLNIEIYGSSHDKKIGARVSGFPSMKIDSEKLKEFLKRRSPNGEIYSTARKETDEPIFENLADNGVIGGDFTVDIYNKDVKSQDYDELYAKPRPSHADYCRFLKNGELSFKGGGEYSGRLTAPYCVVGGLAKQYLEKNYGIKICAYLSSVGRVKGKSYKDGPIFLEEVENISGFPSLDSSEKMLEEIERARLDQNSVGATVECIVYGMKKGVGGAGFWGLEGKISHTVYAISGVKGVEFGDGFDISEKTGFEANDQLEYVGGQVKIMTNSAGGINGGISNGNPITLKVAFRPTPSIAKPQKTVDLEKGENVEIQIKGRHDACFAVRAVPVVESGVAIAVLDAILGEEDEND